MRAYDATGWIAWRRSVDYYDEGTLIWLEVDTKIRQLTKGQAIARRLLPSFLRRPRRDGRGEDVRHSTILSRTSNAVAPYDWKSLLTQRLTETADHAAAFGLSTRGLARDARRQADGVRESRPGPPQADRSLLLHRPVARTDGKISDVIPDTPAYKAGVGPGMKVVAVNTRRFTPQVLDEALAARKKPGHPITLLIEDGDFFRTYALDYHGGPRHPRLERMKGQPDLLSKILAPLTGPVAKTPAATP